MIETINILKGQEDYLQEKIDKLNRKAIKIGCPVMTLTFGEDIIRKYRDEYGRKRVSVKVPATLDYEIPIIDGFELISTFDIYPTAPDADGNVENIVTTSTVPGRDLPTKYLDKKEIHCDHCGHNRFRTHSMLMRDVNTGEYKEVGSTCIRDFFGHDPVAFMRWASWDFEGMVNELPEEEAGFGENRNIRFLDLTETLIYTSAVIRKFGWMSKSKAYQTGKEWTTYEEVLLQMFPPTDLKENDRVKIDDRDKEIAEATIAHFAGDDIDLTNDYLSNCNKMTALGYVPMKHVGLTVSMVPSYQRAAAEKKNADESTSEFVGQIWDKLNGIEATVAFSKEINTDYGVSVLYIFKDAAGNDYKTFYTGSKWTCYEGDEVILTGTVKDHQVYQGKKATMLTRCSVKVTKEAEEDVA